jgi:hypothetical protein
MKYRVRVVRTQVAERFVRATDEQFGVATAARPGNGFKSGR